MGRGGRRGRVLGPGRLLHGGRLRLRRVRLPHGGGRGVRGTGAARRRRLRRRGGRGLCRTRHAIPGALRRDRPRRAPLPRRAPRSTSRRSRLRERRAMRPDRRRPLDLRDRSRKRDPGVPCVRPSAESRPGRALRLDLRWTGVLLRAVAFLRLRARRPAVRAVGAVRAARSPRRGLLARRRSRRSPILRDRHLVRRHHLRLPPRRRRVLPDVRRPGLHGGSLRLRRPPRLRRAGRRRTLPLRRPAPARSGLLARRGGSRLRERGVQPRVHDVPLCGRGMGLREADQRIRLRGFGRHARLTTRRGRLTARDTS